MNWNITSWLWLLGFGALFFWMMRKGGCGMHGAHGHSHAGGEPNGDRHGDGSSTPMIDASTFRDPVCGMRVDPGSAVGVRVVRGRNYFLCSGACLAKFDANPDRYASQTSDAGGSTPQHSRHAGCH